VKGLAPGDRVAHNVTAECGRCPNCQRGRHSQCGGLLGSYRFAVTIDGMMAEYFVAPEADFNLARIPDAVTDEQAVLVSDTISTGFSGAERGEIPLGGAVAVFGQGHIGLGATAGARLVGAGLVIAVKATPRRFELSRTLGADVVLATGERDPVAAIMELTDGAGVDTAIVAAGGDEP